jgi:hypothetical protein
MVELRLKIFNQAPRHRGEWRSGGSVNNDNYDEV